MSDMLQEFEKKIVAKRLELEEEENALKVFKRFMGIAETNKSDEVSVSHKKESASFDDLFSGINTMRKRFLVDEVRDLMPTFGANEFTVAIVQKALMLQGGKLEAEYPRPRIATALGKLVNDGVLVLSFKGVGNNPHVYKVKEEVTNKDVSEILDNS